MKILLTHGYFLNEDPKELQIMKPYVPLGILYISAFLEQQGFANEVFDSTFASFDALMQRIRTDKPDVLALLTLGDKLYRTQDGLELFGEFLTASLADRIRARAHAGAPGMDRWVAVLNRLEQGFARATGLHLEPRQTILTAARDLSHAARGGAI